MGQYSPNHHRMHAIRPETHLTGRTAPMSTTPDYHRPPGHFRGNIGRTPGLVNKHGAEGAVLYQTTDDATAALGLTPKSGQV
jgi:hypothetical protein